jgi:dihydrofolate reductase
VARLIYSAIASLDGYTADASGSFEWAAPDAEVHGFVNDLEREAGTYLYGRRMYETMAVWETMDVSDEPEPIRDYAQIWRAADKVVYSRTVAEPATPRTRIEREFDPAAVLGMKAAAGRDLTIGGPEIAAHSLRAGIVDECRLFLCPVAVGGGARALPDGLRVDLELAGEHRFASGVVYLRYRLAQSR